METKVKKVKMTFQCSNWMKCWSGQIGKCTVSEDLCKITYKGKWHGRHGQTGTTLTDEFTVMNGIVIKDTGNGSITASEVIEHMPFELKLLLKIKS